MSSARGRYFDGVSARAREVALEARAGTLRVEAELLSRSAPLAELEISEPSRGTPRILRFADGACCEVTEGPDLDALLAALGHRESSVVRWQLRPGVAAAALALLFALGVAGYIYALPLAGDWVAAALPDSVSRQLGRHTLGILDRSHFSETALTTARQEELRARFGELRAKSGRLPAFRIEFRGAERIGPNALALPGDAIVFTDEIVALARSDDELVGVFAHELGHLAYRHSLRSLVQSSVVALAAALYLGDVSSLAAGLATFLLEARYSRDFEREADAFAAELLRAQGLSTRPLARMLARLEGEEDPEGAARKLEAAPGAEAAGYLSTHPLTAERIRALIEP